MARDHLGGKEMEVGRFYLKKVSYLAGINRFKRVVTDYQTTSHTLEALYRLAEGRVRASQWLRVGRRKREKSP